MNETKIEWCTKSLNPVVGCTFNCPYCYARKLNNRFKWIDNWNKPKFYPERLKQLSMKKPQNIFMNSMSDIADWEEDWINAVAYYVEKYPQHNYLFLTKRIDCLFQFEDKFLNLLKHHNVWIGITVNNNSNVVERLGDLKDIGIYHCHTFVSVEPINEYIYEEIKGVDWIIVGAETGNRKGKIIPQPHFTYFIERCARLYNIPLFYKESMKEIVGEDNMFREFPKDLSNE